MNVANMIAVVEMTEEETEEVETEGDAVTTVGTVVVTEIIEAETEEEMIGNAQNAATTISLGEIPVIVVQQNALRMLEAAIEAAVATTEETVAVTEIIEAETEEDVATTVETVVVTETIEAETVETAVANVVAIEEIAVIIEAVIEVGSATGETEMVEKRRATIRKRRSQIIHSTKKETINSQRVSPHSEQYFSPRFSSLFIEYFLHSGHGGNPVLVFFTLRNLRRICNLGQPFFGLRTFGILSPYLDVVSSFIKSSNQIRGY